ncbi:MAG: hypothetical protein ACRENG_07030, partial [bacterium]
GEMMKPNIIYQSEEAISGFSPISKESIEYSATIIIKDSGKKPVSINMKFKPPHPYLFSMPLEHKVEAESLTQAYAKIMKFLKKFGFELH